MAFFVLYVCMYTGWESCYREENYSTKKIKMLQQIQYSTLKFTTQRMEVWWRKISTGKKAPQKWPYNWKAVSFFENISHGMLTFGWAEVDALWIRTETVLSMLQILLKGVLSLVARVLKLWLLESRHGSPRFFTDYGESILLSSTPNIQTHGSVCLGLKARFCFTKQKELLNGRKW